MLNRGGECVVVSVARPEGMGGSGSGWQREAPALLSTALLLGGALPERPPAPLFTIDSILAPRPAPPGPPLQLHLHAPFHRAPELFGTSAKMFMMGETYFTTACFYSPSNLLFWPAEYDKKHNINKPN